MHGLHVSCPFNFPNGNLKQQWSHIGFFICCQTIDAKKKLNFPISGIHLLNPYKTVVSHLNFIGPMLFSGVASTGKKLQGTGSAVSGQGSGQGLKTAGHAH